MRIAAFELRSQACQELTFLVLVHVAEGCSMEVPSAHLRALCYTVFLLVDLKVADATAGVRHRSWLRGRRLAA
jgi:hypothetical protein